MTFLKVNRNYSPRYPNFHWMKKVIHPELDLVGPTEFSINDFELLVHANLSLNGELKCQVVYDQLIDQDILIRSLGLAELLEIKRKGEDFFRKNWRGKSLLGWKSVIEDNDGILYIPYLSPQHTNFGCVGGGTINGFYLKVFWWTFSKNLKKEHLTFCFKA